MGFLFRELGLLSRSLGFLLGWYKAGSKLELETHGTW